MFAVVNEVHFFIAVIVGIEINLTILQPNTKNAKIAQLVERHLAKVEVAGSNPVFRSRSTARVVELVDTLDLKSNGQ